MYDVYCICCVVRRKDFNCYLKQKLGALCFPRNKNDLNQRSVPLKIPFSCVTKYLANETFEQVQGRKFFNNYFVRALGWVIK